MQANTVFDRRFVLECCERFHIHWRNVRLELTPENWIGLSTPSSRQSQPGARTARRGSTSTSSSPSYLMDTREIVHPTEVEVELCENLYKAARDARRRRRVLGGGRLRPLPLPGHALRDVDRRLPRLLEGDGRGRERLQTVAVQAARQALRAAERPNILYTVLRNWEGLPDSVEVGPHSDLDLLVHRRTSPSSTSSGTRR